MAQTLTGSVVTTPTFTYVNTLDQETVQSALKATTKRTITYTSGTGANQVNAMWSDDITLTTTASTTLDLEALTNAYGTLTFTGIKELYVWNTTTNSGYRVVVGAADANQFTGPLGSATDTVQVNENGLLHLSAPVTAFTVDGTHSDLKIANPSGGSCTVRIVIVGTGTVA